MRFQLESSTLSQLIKAGIAGTFALAIFTACSDKISGPAREPLLPAGAYTVEYLIPDSEKNPSQQAFDSWLRGYSSLSMSMQSSTAFPSSGSLSAAIPSG